MRAIDADALIKMLIRKEPFSDCARVVIAECIEEIRHAPTIKLSAQPERKSGKWIEIKRSDINPLTGRCGVYVGCSECGAPIPTDSQLDYIDESEANYCINCGTDMRGTERREE